MLKGGARSLSGRLLDPQGLAARVFRPVRVALCFLHGRKHLPSVADFMRGKTGMELVKRHGLLGELTGLLQFVLFAEEVGEMVQ